MERARRAAEARDAAEAARTAAAEAQQAKLAQTAWELSELAAEDAERILMSREEERQRAQARLARVVKLAASDTAKHLREGLHALREELLAALSAEGAVEQRAMLLRATERLDALARKQASDDAAQGAALALGLGRAAEARAAVAAAAAAGAKAALRTSAAGLRQGFEEEVAALKALGDANVRAEAGARLKATGALRREFGAKVDAQQARRGSAETPDCDNESAALRSYGPDAHCR